MEKSVASLIDDFKGSAVSFEDSTKTNNVPSNTTLPINIYFEKTTDNKVIFKGEYMEVYISASDLDHKIAIISGNEVKMYGIFELRIWDKKPNNPETEPFKFKTRYMYPSMFDSIPTNINKRSMSLLGEESSPYIVLEYHKDSIFIKNTKIPKASDQAAMLLILISSGFTPKIIKYDEFSSLLIQSGAINGVKFDVSNTVFEIMVATQARDASDLTNPFRFVYNKTKGEADQSKMKFLSVSEIPHILDTFSSFSFQNIDYAITASARRTRKSRVSKSQKEADKKSDIENLLNY